MVKNLIVGGDLFSLATYQALSDKFGDEVLIVNSRPIHAEDLKNIGPSSLRGLANISVFNFLYPELSKTENFESYFYKESRLNSFKGRAKPAKLQWGEDFFTSPRVDYDPLMLFPYLNNLDFYKNLNSVTDTIISISHEENFEITCASGKTFGCEKLFFGDGPFAFIQLFTPKEKLSNQFLQFCEDIKTPFSLKIKFFFNNQVTENLCTLFIPLSHTYDLGHFVGEFSGQGKNQVANFIHFIDPAHISEEEIGKRIRLLKRNLEKIIPTFAKIPFKEHITLSSKTSATDIDDHQFEKISGEIKNLFFIGENAVFPSPEDLKNKFGYPLKQISHLSRGLLSHQNIFLNN